MYLLIEKIFFFLFYSAFYYFGSKNNCIRAFLLLYKMNMYQLYRISVWCSVRRNLIMVFMLISSLHVSSNTLGESLNFKKDTSNDFKSTYKVHE